MIKVELKDLREQMCAGFTPEGLSPKRTVVGIPKGDNYAICTRGYSLVGINHHETLICYCQGCSDYFWFKKEFTLGKKTV